MQIQTFFLLVLRPLPSLEVGGGMTVMLVKTVSVQNRHTCSTDLDEKDSRQEKEWMTSELYFLCYPTLYVLYSSCIMEFFLNSIQNLLIEQNNCIP